MLDPLFRLPKSMSLASLTLVAIKLEPPESGWLAIMIFLWAALILFSAALSRTPARMEVARGGEPGVTQEKHTPELRRA